MMVAGSAAPAAAASHIDFSGYYRAYFSNDVNINKRDGDTAYTDSYFGHRLNIDMTFTPTDEIQVFWRLRAPSWARWGNGAGRLGNLQTAFIYGQIKQDWGTVLVGKLNDGLDSYGLGSLGYAAAYDPMWTYVSPFDGGGNIDAVRYFNKWDNGFGIMGQYAKIADDGVNLSTGGTDYSNQGWSDGSWDRYQLEATYEWDGGGAAFGVEYDRNAAFEGADTRGIGIRHTDAWYINPAIMQSWGDFSVHLEGQYGWGKAYTVGNGSGKANGWGLYADADYNYGPGNVTLSGWYTSGDDYDDNGDTRDGLVEINRGNFYPLIVAYNATASGWGRNTENAATAANAAFNLYVAEGYAPKLGAGGFGFGNVAYTGVGITPSATADNDFSTWLSSGSLWAGRVNNQIAGTGIAPSLENFQELAFMDRTRGITFVDQEWTGSGFNFGESNHWALMLGGNHAFTDDISMHYGIGYLALTKPNYRIMDSASFTAVGTTQTVGDADQYGFKYKEQDKDLGIELDLGFEFKLLDNLTFNTSFGYMFNGDAYKTLKGYRATANIASAGAVTDGDTVRTKAVWEDADDSYVWYNTLTFSF